MQFRVVQALLAMVLASGPASAGSQEPVKTHLMWHLFPAGSATPELASRVEMIIRRHFEQKHGDLLMDGMYMDSLLLVEGNEKFLRCGVGAGCLAGLGQTAKMAQVIAGEVGLNQGRTSVNLVLVGVKSSKVVSRAKVYTTGLPDEKLLEELRVAMFEPGRYHGSLELTVSAAGAEVRVDGRKVGVTPLVGPLANIPAGERELTISKPGHETFRRTVQVPLDGSLPLKVHLVEIRLPVKPFYRDWPFWTTAGISTISLLAGVLLHLDANVLQDNADACRKADLDCDREQQDKADARYLQTYLAYGVGAAGLLAAGIIVLLDDSQPEKPVSVGFFPAPGGAGLSATYRF